MNTITELKTKEGSSTGLIAVKVPKDASDIQLHNTSVSYYQNGIGTIIAPIELSKGGYELLGLVTDSAIGFDAKILENELSGANSDTQRQIGDVIRSLLAVSNLYWENPIGDEPYYNDYVPAYLDDNFNKRNKEEEYYQIHEQWQSCESNLLADSNLLILKKL